MSIVASRDTTGLTPRGRSWLRKAERALDRMHAAASIGEQAASAALLIDGGESDAAECWLARLGPVHSDIAALAYVRAYAFLRRNELERARAQFTRAQTAVGEADALLAARIALELGALYLRLGRPSTADAVLAWAQGTISDGSLGDLLQLRALIADASGDYRSARRFFREAIAARNTLTPQTRLLAMHNLAVSLAHSEPLESIELVKLALEQVGWTGYERLRPALFNVGGYARLCTGDIAEARLALTAALDEAGARDNREVSSFARFNLAIAAELNGELGRAKAMLMNLMNEIESSQPALHVWVRLRLSWLALLDGDYAAARRDSASAIGAVASEGMRDAAAIVGALCSIAAGDVAGASGELAGLEQRAADRDDAISQFALTLWRATAERQSGRSAMAVRLERRAVELGATHGFRLSPNWWTTDLADRAAAAAPAAMNSRFLPSCRFPSSSQPPVHVSVGGFIEVQGIPMPDDVWRTGKTGPRVLRRLFQLLAVSYPKALSTHRLCDVLWPDSDGDRATANLYASISDLRRALAHVPGVRVSGGQNGYRLTTAVNVTVSNAVRVPTDHRAHRVARTQPPSDVARRN